MTDLTHARSCEIRGLDGWNRGDCTCGLEYRIHIKELEAVSVASQKRLKHLLKWFHGYRTPELTMAAMMERIEELEAQTEILDIPYFLRAPDAIGEDIKREFEKLQKQIKKLEISVKAYSIKAIARLKRTEELEIAVFNLDQVTNEQISKVLELEDQKERLINHAATLGYCLVQDDSDLANESWRSLPQELMDALNTATEKLEIELNAIDHPDTELLREEDEAECHDEQSEKD